MSDANTESVEPTEPTENTVHVENTEHVDHDMEQNADVSSEQSPKIDSSNIVPLTADDIPHLMSMAGPWICKVYSDECSACQAFAPTYAAVSQLRTCAKIAFICIPYSDELDKAMKEAKVPDFNGLPTLVYKTAQDAIDISVGNLSQTKLVQLCKMISAKSNRSNRKGGKKVKAAKLDGTEDAKALLIKAESCHANQLTSGHDEHDDKPVLFYRSQGGEVDEMEWNLEVIKTLEGYGDLCSTMDFVDLARVPIEWDRTFTPCVHFKDDSRLLGLSAVEYIRDFNTINEHLKNESEE